MENVIKTDRWGLIIWTGPLKKIIKDILEVELRPFAEDKPHFYKTIQWSKSYITDPRKAAGYYQVQQRLTLADEECIWIKVTLSWHNEDFLLKWGKIVGWSSSSAYFTIPICEINAQLREKKLKKLLE